MMIFFKQASKQKNKKNRIKLKPTAYKMCVFLFCSVEGSVEQQEKSGTKVMEYILETYKPI